MDSLLETSGQQVDYMTQSLENQQRFRNDPTVQKYVPQVATAMAILRALKAYKQRHYWDPTYHEASKKKAAKYMQNMINRYMREMANRPFYEDTKYYRDPDHPNEPMHLVFTVLSEEQVRTLVQKHGDYIPYRKRKQAYAIPKYLVRKPTRRNIDVHQEHWQQVLHKMQQSLDETTFEKTLLNARRLSNRRLNQYRRNHPEDTRSQSELVRAGALQSVMETAWTMMLEEVFDSVQEGCREVHYKWSLSATLPKNLAVDPIAPSSIPDHLREAVDRYLDWYYFRKARMAKFRENNGTQIREVEQQRNEGRCLLQYMDKYQVSHIELNQVLFNVDHTVLPTVELRIRRRRKPHLRRPYIRKYFLPHMASNISRTFMQTYQQRLQQQQQTQGKRRGKAKGNQDSELTSVATTWTPAMITNPHVRALSLCHNPYIEMNHMNDIMEETDFVRSAFQTFYRRASHELTYTAQSLMQHERVAQERYLSFEVYLPSRFTYRSDDQLEREVYRFQYS
jgi:hypothetical protein